MIDEFRVVRVGFDTIIVAAKAQLPPDLCNQLVFAREAARERRSAEPIHLCGVLGEVLPHGVQGGYDAVFSTGPLGEMIQFKTAENNDRWTVRIKIRAGSFLAHGYPGAIDLAFKRLFGVVGQEWITDWRLSEVHVCIDVLTTSEFQLEESRFVRPGRATVRPYDIFDDKHPLADECEPLELRRILRGKRLQTVTIGSHATGSQRIIYNKRDEATLRRNKVLFEAYKVNTTDHSWGLWRFEARFRGPVLKEQFRVRSFDDLNSRISPMLDWATSRVRYVLPGQENVHTSRSAIDPFWTIIRKAVPLISVVQPSVIAPALAQNLLDRDRMTALENSVMGAAIGHAAMFETDPERVHRQLPARTAAMIRQKLRQNPDTARAKIERAIERMRSRKVIC